MAPLPIDQESVFYTPDWTRVVENEFISLLVDECLLGCWDKGGGNATAIRIAMKEVNYKFNKSFDFKFCRVRVGRLRNRFRVFNWIISLSGVGYDEVTQKVTCSDDAWDFICEKEKLARCYIESGEQQYESLRCLFHFSSTQATHEQRQIIDIASDEDVEKDFEVPEDIPEVAEREDPFFWDDVADEYNEPSTTDTFPSTGMSSTSIILSKLKNTGPSSSQCNQTGATTSLGSTASYSPHKKC